MQEEMRQISNQLRTSQDKYAYFLLAITASAIAFSMQITKTSLFSYPLIVLGLSVTCWGISFFCGCKHIIYVNSALYTNAEYLQVCSGRHPEIGHDPNVIPVILQAMMTCIQKTSDKAHFYSQWQFYFSIWGGVFFLAWHLIEMGIRSYGY